MQEFFSAVSTIGLPAAICCFLLWQNAKQDDRAREQQDELRKTIEQNTKGLNGYQHPPDPKRIKVTAELDGVTYTGELTAI